MEYKFLYKGWACKMKFDEAWQEWTVKILNYSFHREENFGVCGDKDNAIKTIKQRIDNKLCFMCS